MSRDLRGLFHWLAVSKRRLVTVAAAVVAVVVVGTVGVAVLFVWSASSFRDDFAGASPAAPRTTGPATPNADPQVCASAAIRFLTAFTAAGSTDAQWRNDTGGLLDPHLARFLGTVDRSAIPKSGPPRNVAPLAQPGSCDVSAVLDDGRPVRVELRTQPDGSWRVTDWSWPSTPPASATTRTGAP